MNKVCTVKNKSSSRVFYTTPQYGSRSFYPNHSMPNIAVEELAQLLQQPGGRELFFNYLQIEDKEIVDYLLNDEVPLEYWFKEEDIPNWMNTCSLPEFQDALDFAPQGTKDLITKYAVSMPLNDFSKRQAIKEQLNFDVTKAVEYAEAEAKVESNKPAGRRVEPAAEENKPKRRVVVDPKD